MTGTKTVAERLRNAEGLCATHGFCRVVLHAISGEAICPLTESCEDCKKGILRTLARQIEAEQENLMEKCKHLYENFYEPCAKMGFTEHAHGLEVTYSKTLDELQRLKEEQGEVDIDALRGAKPQLPEGVIWPTYEDGELVKFGQHIAQQLESPKDLTRELNGGVRSLTFAVDYLSVSDGKDELCFLYGEPVKRPEPEVLDADGVPIKVGDTVWHGHNVPLEVTKVCADVVWLNLINGKAEVRVDPHTLTHRKPDTQEAINHDAMLMISESFFDQRRDEFEDRVFDLLKRQRKLLGGE